MFKSALFATALIASANAWERNVKADNFQTEAFGADNSNYGHQGIHGGYGGHGSAYGAHGGAYGAHGNAEWGRADNHNSHRQSGHQGQGHNQWTDNAWNQWGTNNHWDTQKSVDNKWGNNSGKVNVNLNSVSGHYDNDYGHQQRGLGYEGHQNTSGEIGYSIGLGGHSFGYAPGSHSYGYENKGDYGYGGWANNLGAWNHGANYDNLGEAHHDNGRDISNEAASFNSADIKTDRKVGRGYGDLEELDDDREDSYLNTRVGRTGTHRGTGHGFGAGIGNNFGFSGNEFNEFGAAGARFGGRFGGAYGAGYGYGNAGKNVAVAGWNKENVYSSGNKYGGILGDNGYGHGYGAGYGYGNKGYGGYSNSGRYGNEGYENDAGYDQYDNERVGSRSTDIFRSNDEIRGYTGYGKGYGSGYGGYGNGYGSGYGGYGGKTYQLRSSRYFGDKDQGSLNDYPKDAYRRNSYKW